MFWLWGGAFVSGVFCLGLFAGGILRDRGIGNAELPIDLSRAGVWRQVSVRPWFPGRYRLYLSTLVDQPKLREERLSARIEIRVADASGRTVLARSYAPGTLGHLLAPGMTWTRLDEIIIAKPDWKPWTLAASTIEPDPNAARARARLELRRERQEPGMGGLINYAALVPAVVLLAISFVAAILLPRFGGTYIPLLLSAAALGMLVVLPAI